MDESIYNDEQADQTRGDEDRSWDDQYEETNDSGNGTDTEDNYKSRTKRKNGPGQISKERVAANEKVQGQMIVLKEGREQFGMNTDKPATLFGENGSELINFLRDPVYKMTTGYIPITWCLRCWTLHCRDHFKKAFRSLKLLDGGKCPLIIPLHPFFGTRKTLNLTNEQVQEVLLTFFCANHDYIIKAQPDVFTYDVDGWVVDFKGPKIQLAGEKS